MSQADNGVGVEKNGTNTKNCALSSSRSASEGEDDEPAVAVALALAGAGAGIGRGEEAQGLLPPDIWATILGNLTLGDAARTMATCSWLRRGVAPFIEVLYLDSPRHVRALALAGHLSGVRRVCSVRQAVSPSATGLGLASSLAQNVSRPALSSSSSSSSSSLPDAVVAFLRCFPRLENANLGGLFEDLHIVGGSQGSGNCNGNGGNGSRSGNGTAVDLVDVILAKLCKAYRDKTLSSEAVVEGLVCSSAGGRSCGAWVLFPEGKCALCQDVCSSFPPSFVVSMRPSNLEFYKPDLCLPYSRCIHILGNRRDGASYLASSKALLQILRERVILSAASLSPDVPLARTFPTTRPTTTTTTTTVTTGNRAAKKAGRGTYHEIGTAVELGILNLDMVAFHHGTLTKLGVLKDAIGTDFAHVDADLVLAALSPGQPTMAPAMRIAPDDFSNLVALGVAVQPSDFVVVEDET